MSSVGINDKCHARRMTCLAIWTLVLASPGNVNAQPIDVPPPPPSEGAKEAPPPKPERPRDRWRAKRGPNMDRDSDNPRDANRFDERDDRPGRHGGPPDMIRWESLPDPEKHQIEKFMEENVPRIYMELQGLKSGNPERYNRRMSRVAPEMKRLMDVMRADPQRGELMLKERKVQVEIRITTAQYHKATDEARRQQLKARLVDLCTQAFDCQTQRRQMEVKDLEARLSGLKSRVAESANMKASLIQARVKDLIEHPENRRPKGSGRGEDDDPETDGPQPHRSPETPAPDRD